MIINNKRVMVIIIIIIIIIVLQALILDTGVGCSILQEEDLHGEAK
uniref:Uncharacterized protein n=1 Tax=Brassica campestris TaxID=3711 RepID=A0A3P5ZK18_BRACM|nr:unnamed protein product [Brassica rapa]